MKTVFFGSDDFAAEHLKTLIHSAHEVMCCVTQPDRPKGRGMKIIVSPVKACAIKHNIPVLQPASLKDDALTKKLQGFQSDLFVVIAYGQFLPSKVLMIPPLGAINVHASLLPKYRGAAPINWAIINGEKETGISIIKINEAMDAGDILAEERIKIDQKDTAITLRGRMIKKGPAFLLKTMDDLTGCTPRRQDNGLATFAPKLTKELGRIEWNTQAHTICNLVRGLLPWPSAYTFYKAGAYGRTPLLKILEAQVVEGDFASHEPGTVSEVGKKGIVVATGRNGILIKQVHLQDSKSMSAHNFVIGHNIREGFKFG